MKCYVNKTFVTTSRASISSAIISHEEISEEGAGSCQFGLGVSFGQSEHRVFFPTKI